jgi:hypothetical protein
MTKHQPSPSSLRTRLRLAKGFGSASEGSALAPAPRWRVNAFGVAQIIVIAKMKR